MQNAVTSESVKIEYIAASDMLDLPTVLIAVAKMKHQDKWPIFSYLDGAILIP